MQNKTLNSFTLKHLIGKGGMAEVWYAENNLGKPAAVKIMLQKFIGEQQVVSRFEIEAKAMVQLNHPNIRQVYDLGEYEQRPFIVMEYLDGEDLSEFIKHNKKPTESQLQLWWQQCTDALEFTHNKGIIHRDIKPSNLFLTKEGTIKILDFGIAKVKQEISITGTGQALGTILYMSPEQIIDPKRVTKATDYYSLAVSFIHLISGKSPFSETESQYKLQSQIVKGEIDLSNLSENWRGKLLSYLQKTKSKKSSVPKSPRNVSDITEVIGGNEKIKSIQSKTQVDVKKQDNPVNKTVTSSSNTTFNEIKTTENRNIKNSTKKDENKEDAFSLISLFPLFISIVVAIKNGTPWYTAIIGIMILYAVIAMILEKFIKKDNIVNLIIGLFFLCFQYFYYTKPITTSGANNETEDVSNNFIKQDGTINEFLESYLIALSNGNKEYIEKVILKDEDGKIFGGVEEINNPNFHDFYLLEKQGEINRSLIIVKDNRIKVENFEGFLKESAQILRNRFDEKSLEESESVTVTIGNKEDFNVGGGIYHKYKGKWYIHELPLSSELSEYENVIEGKSQIPTEVAK